MEELVKKAQNGDDEAFSEIVSDLKERLYRTAYSYLRDEGYALEAVAEATCRAYISIRKLKDCKYFSTWITRILINYCLDELKYMSKHSPMEQIDYVPVFISDEENNLEIRLDLMESLELIKPKYRDVIILRYLEDVSVKDIAKSLNKPENTVKTWISRGLSQLRKHMKGSEHYA